MDRDRLLKDVLTELPEEDRGRFMEMCMEKIPDDVAFIDGVVVMSIAARMKEIMLCLSGVPALNPVDPFLNKPDGYKADENGRIIALDSSRWHWDVGDWDGWDGDKKKLPVLPDPDADTDLAAGTVLGMWLARAILAAARLLSAAMG